MKIEYSQEQITRGCSKGCLFLDKRKIETPEYCGYTSKFKMPLQFGKLGGCKCRRKIGPGR